MIPSKTEYVTNIINIMGLALIDTNKFVFRKIGIKIIDPKID